MPSRISSAALAAAALALASPSLAEAPDARAREADIRRLMDLTGAGALGVQAAHQMIAALRPLIPQAPESFWREFEAKLDPDEFVELVVPIYAKHLSAKEVRDIIAFFESPSGRKLSRVQPVMMQEAMQAGEAWGSRVAESLVRSARAQGFEVKSL